VKLKNLDPHQISIVSLTFCQCVV